MTRIDKVVDEFTLLFTQAEALLARAGSETGEDVRDLQAEVGALLLNAKSRLIELEEEATERAAAAARAGDDYVHEHPWQAVGLAAVAGFVLGALITRR